MCLGSPNRELWEARRRPLTGFAKVRACSYARIRWMLRAARGTNRAAQTQERGYRDALLGPEIGGTDQRADRVCGTDSRKTLALVLKRKIA